MKSRRPGRTIPRLVIAGMKGGSGKTTVALGLIGAWRRRGLSVVPFKKGPDYIDAGWLSSAAGRPCFNLDPFLVSRENILFSFHRRSLHGDCALIEGNRGLYDGMDAEGTFSTAELSKMLHAPVILVMDCTKVTRTAGAMVMGIQRFDRAVRLGGVVLNQVAGARHEKILREVIERYCRVPAVGAIPRFSNEFLAERHMGLTPFQEHPEVDEVIAKATEIADKYLDVEATLRIAAKARPLPAVVSAGEDALGEEPPSPPLCCGTDEPVGGEGKVRIGIIRDSAFQFYYPENFEELERRGACLVGISAVTEKRLPPVDALYIGGGFPETNAIALARNRSFRTSLRRAAEDGLPVYAECGGLMYLGTSIVFGGERFPMAGVFPLSFCLEEKPQAHGYSVVEVKERNPFYGMGTVLRGHEFHYSRVLNFRQREGVRFAFRMRRGAGISEGRDGISYKNVLATYTHVHALGTPEWADGLVRRARSYKRERQ